MSDLVSIHEDRVKFIYIMQLRLQYVAYISYNLKENYICLGIAVKTGLGEEPYKQFCFRSNPFILIMFTCTYLCNVKSCEIKYV